MSTFDTLGIKKALQKALHDRALTTATPIQQAAFGPIVGGADFVGIAQTGTGKTLAYLLPLLHSLPYSEQIPPRVLILVPTRELVIQLVAELEKLTAYMNVRTLGVYGGTNNMKAQKVAVAQGVDVLVGTPRRVYDLALSKQLRLKEVKKLVVDEVDIMLDFGYKTQLRHIFDLLPTKRQNLLFSATMTTYVEALMDTFLTAPIKKTMAVSGTPLENIRQYCYAAPNFYTKANLLNYLLQDRDTFGKVLIFVATRAQADRLLETLDFEGETALIHAGKEQNYRLKAIESFARGDRRILIATDVIARGIDIENIDTVISLDTPRYPENYIHRMGRTGRAGAAGRALLLYSEAEQAWKTAIEQLMDYPLPQQPLPPAVEVSDRLTPEELAGPDAPEEEPLSTPKIGSGGAFHEKSAKNSKQPAERKSYRQQLKETYKKPLRKGDKIQNRKKKKKR